MSRARNFLLKLRYDGTNFCGWQKQPGRRSVQETVEQAIAAITQHPTIRLNASGRTDAGVHACGQTANFYCATALPCAVLLRGINALLPADVVAVDLQEVPQSFDANKDVYSKRYRYWIQTGAWADPLLQRYAWFVRGALDCAVMQLAAQQLLGRHDFRAFATTGSTRLSSWRTVLAVEVVSVGKCLRIDVEADGFLYNMVRTIVGSLVEVGRHRWPAERLGWALRSRDRRWAGPNAPPHGLYLLQVRYDPSQLFTTAPTPLEQPSGYDHVHDQVANDDGPWLLQIPSSS